MGKQGRRVCVCALAILLFAVALRAQETTARLRGGVLDPSGAGGPSAMQAKSRPVPNPVTVSVSNTQTGNRLIQYALIGRDYCGPIHPLLVSSLRRFLLGISKDPTRSGDDNTLQRGGRNPLLSSGEQIYA